MKHREAKRIVLATVGSLGDLHPCLVLAVELNRRGHQVRIASTEFYRAKVEEQGIEFWPMRPNWKPNDQELIRQCEDLRSGPEVLFRKLILPELRGTYEDLLAAASGADLMIAGELVYAAPLVAEKLQLRWVSAILSPVSFFSAYDPSILVNAPALIHLRKAGRPLYQAALHVARMATRHWWNPVRRLREEQGLRLPCDPLFRDKFSPHLVLALFSPHFAKPQPDWPSQTQQPGFLFYDPQERSVEAQELAAFLCSGDPPIVFTLGSTAVHHPGNFYDASVQAANKLGRRAILLGAPAALQSPAVLALPYAAYFQIFPHAAVIVHQGGAGTTGQALRAGRPMLIVPYGWDQPDHGARIARLGAGLTVSRAAYSTKTATAALERLTEETSFAIRATKLGSALREEDGCTAACDAIESVLLKSTGAVS